MTGRDDPELRREIERIGLAAMEIHQREIEALGGRMARYLGDRRAGTPSAPAPPDVGGGGT